MDNSVDFPNFSIVQIEATNIYLKVNLMIPEQLYFTWPKLEYVHFNCPIDIYKITCIDAAKSSYTVGFDGETLTS